MIKNNDSQRFEFFPAIGKNGLPYWRFYFNFAGAYYAAVLWYKENELKCTVAATKRTIDASTEEAAIDIYKDGIILDMAEYDDDDDRPYFSCAFNFLGAVYSFDIDRPVANEKVKAILYCGE